MRRRNTPQRQHCNGGARQVWHRAWPVVLMWSVAAFFFAAWLVTWMPRDVAALTWTGP